MTTQGKALSSPFPRLRFSPGTSPPPASSPLPSFAPQVPARPLVRRQAVQEAGVSSWWLLPAAPSSLLACNSFLSCFVCSGTISFMGCSPSGCPSPRVGHPQPQSLGVSLSWCELPVATVPWGCTSSSMELLFPRVPPALSPKISPSTCLLQYIPVCVLTWQPPCLHLCVLLCLLFCPFSSVSLSTGTTCLFDGLKSWPVVGYIIGGCDQHREVPAASSEMPVAPATKTLPCIPSMRRHALHHVANIKKLIKKLFFGRKNIHFIFCGNQRAFQ